MKPNLLGFSQDFIKHLRPDGVKISTERKNMGVESLGVGLVQVGASVGRMASGLSGGARIAAFNSAEFAPISGISPVINEGPVAPSFPENNMIHTNGNFAPKGEINFVPSGILEAAADKWAATEPVSNSISEVSKDIPDVVSDAQNIAAKVWKTDQPAAQVEPLVIAQAKQVAADWEANQPVSVPEAFVNPAPVSAENQALIEAVRKELRLASASRVSPRVSASTEQPVAASPKVEEQIAQAEEEIIKSAIKDDQQDSEARELEEVEKSMLYHVEAEEVSRDRELWIGEAGQKADAEVNKEADKLGVEAVGIDGERVGDILAKTETEKVISPTRRGKGPDGSLKLTIQAVKSGFYRSVDEIKKAARVIIPKNRPDKLAKKGNLLEDKEVAKTEMRHIFRLGKATAEVIATIHKKRTERIKKAGKAPVSETTVETKQEGSKIEDTELAEVLVPSNMIKLAP